MASNTDYLPDEITYGFVADRVLLAIGDTASDDDRYPDGVPAQGTVRFSPERTILYTQDRPATVLPQDIECTIYHRDHPVAVNNGYEPELVGKLVDPAGHVGNVALIVGWYEVVYRLSTGTAQRFRFQVLPEHTNADPLWLPEVAPLSPTPSERFVVNEQVYNDTKTARDQAEQYRDTTRTLRNEAEAYREQAQSAASSALNSATTSGEILEQVQDLGITVDTSVGTRVFVGDTMIHGDTGWRDFLDYLSEGWSTEISAPALRYKRENNIVFAQIRVRKVGDASGSVTNVAVGLPSGFRPQSYVLLPGSVQDSSTGPSTAVMTSRLNNITLDVRGVTFQAGSELVATVVYHTPDPWPSRLPGNPA